MSGVDVLAFNNRILLGLLLLLKMLDKSIDLLNTAGELLLAWSAQQAQTEVNLPDIELLLVFIAFNCCLHLVGIEECLL